MERKIELSRHETSSCNTEMYEIGLFLHHIIFVESPAFITFVNNPNFYETNFPLYCCIFVSTLYLVSAGACRIGERLCLS